MARQFSHMEDKALLRIIASKNEDAHAAFAEVYSRYGTRVYAYIVRIVGRREQAEDIFQETFLRFYRASAENAPGSLIGFLITVARNLCLNHKRDRKPTVTLDAFDLSQSEHASLENREFLDLLRRAIDLLDFDLREPLILRVYNELSYAEVAELCGIAEATARVRVLRAKKKIRSILSPIIKELNR